MSALNTPIKLTVGVTGHRDLVDGELEGLQQRVRTFFKQLMQQFPDLELELISGMAAGADSLVAQVALDLSIPVTAVLPFEQSEYERDFEEPKELETFQTLLQQCQSITLPLLQGASHQQIQSNADTRTHQYAQLGIFISNHCQVLLALWDGKPTVEVGGTHGVLRYHLTGVMPGFALTDESPNLLADNENDLAFHIACSRAREDGAPEASFTPLQESWLSAHFDRVQGDTSMPEAYRQMFERLAIFSSDCHRFAADIGPQARSLITDPPDAPMPEECEIIDRLFQSADWLAVRYQKLFSRGLLLSHALAVIMGLVFIVYSEFVEFSVLAWLFLSLFVFGAGFHYVGDRREWHRKYLDYRALAEGLRVQVYWNLAGVVDGHKAEFAYDNFLQKQDVDLAWIRHVMRSASLQSYRLSRPDDRWVDWVAEQWVGSTERGSGQLAYYESKALLRSAKYRRTLQLSTIALWVGVSTAAFLGAFTARLDEVQILVLMILMGVLPLLAGVRDAYSHKKADKELIKQYQFMSRIFANARRLLDDAQDFTFKRRVLKAVGSAALEEHAEWLLMHRERPLEQSGFQ